MVNICFDLLFSLSQVPLGDVLNHIAKHNAELEFGENELVMKSVEFIPAGQEVFNTYGQIANKQLLQVFA